MVDDGVESRVSGKLPLRCVTYFQPPLPPFLSIGALALDE